MRELVRVRFRRRPISKIEASLRCLERLFGRSCVRISAVNADAFQPHIRLVSNRMRPHGLLSFFAAVGYDFYRATIQMNEQAAMNIAALAEQTIARDIELYDLSLQSVLDGVNDPDIRYQEPGLRQKILFDRSATAPGLGSLTALDEKGSIFLDSHGFPPRQGNFVDREYFKAHQDSNIGLYVSQPYMARLQENIWSISVSRRINKPDGSFGGIVSGTIRLSYFERIFNRVTMGERDTIVLLRTDGTLVAHNANVADKIGADWHPAPVFTRLANRSQGTFTSHQSMDGVSRLFAFHRVGELPLVVVVGLSTDQILAPWRSKMLVLAGIFAIMVSSVLILVWMLESELRRRAAAEKAAETLARTDGLPSFPIAAGSIVVWPVNGAAPRVTAVRCRC